MTLKAEESSVTNSLQKIAEELSFDTIIIIDMNESENDGGDEN